MKVIETRTQYAAIHPRFPVISLAQTWGPSLTQAMLDAETLRQIVGMPVKVMRRTVITETSFEDVVTVDGKPRKPANGEDCAEFEENGSCIHSDHTN